MSEVSNFLGTVHHEYVFTIEEALDALPDVKGPKGLFDRTMDDFREDLYFCQHFGHIHGKSCDNKKSESLMTPNDEAFQPVLSVKNMVFSYFVVINNFLRPLKKQIQGFHPDDLPVSQAAKPRLMGSRSFRTRGWWQFPCRWRLMLIHPWSRAQYHTGINDQIPPRHRFNYNVTTKMSSFFLTT